MLTRMVMIKVVLIEEWRRNLIFFNAGILDSKITGREKAVWRTPVMTRSPSGMKGKKSQNCRRFCLFSRVAVVRAIRLRVMITI